VILIPRSWKAGGRLKRDKADYRSKVHKEVLRFIIRLSCSIFNQETRRLCDGLKDDQFEVEMLLRGALMAYDVIRFDYGRSWQLLCSGIYSLAPVTSLVFLSE
jgi:hypothetical protein